MTLVTTYHEGKRYPTSHLVEACVTHMTCLLKLQFQHKLKQQSYSLAMKFT